MNRKAPRRVVSGKPIRITFGVIQTEIVNKAANKLDMSPQQFLREATMKACDNAATCSRNSR